MGIDALTRRADGSEVAVPVSDDDWRRWVSAGRTRNWMLGDPLIDWLQLYGKSRDYIPRENWSGYEKDLDFLAFIFERGREFEAGILRLFQDQHEVVTIAQDSREIRRLDKAQETFEAMRKGAPLIYQAVLWDAHNMTYGSPDFLIRSDVLSQMFPNCITEQDAATSAPDLGANSWHYRVVDTKFTTLRLNARGTELDNSDSAPAYKAQLYIYNRMLGRLQGFEPPESYLLGRGWRQQSTTHRGTNAMERLGPIPQNGTVANKVPLADKVEKALRWVRRVRTEGQGWQLLPKPSVPELYPNMGNTDDGNMMREIDPAEPQPGVEQDESPSQWVGVKKWLADELKELTQLWQVGVDKRKEAHESGIYRWDDPQVTPEGLGIKGEKQAPILKRVLTINRPEYDGPLVLPSRVEAEREQWYPAPGVEFYVDFEFCSDLNDNFSKLPEKAGQPLIFMIGCGHMEKGEWQFKSLVANYLTEDEELRIIQEWVAHMVAVRDRLDPANSGPRIFHWSDAEVKQLEKNYNSARVRHQGDWPELGWYDFLGKVIKKEPVVVRGGLSFGLKAVANAMHSHGLIETNWADSPVDGLGAMVGAWRCDEEARKKGVPMSALPLMGEIARYNEVDCKMMMEIVRYLRANH